MMRNNLTTPLIGHRIRTARRAADLTLEEVGRRIGISNQALSAIERGKKNPSRQTLMNLARVLGQDFGERWLAEHLSEHQAEFQLVSVSQGANLIKENLMQLFEEFLDTKYGSGQVKVIPDYTEKAVSIPVSYTISNSIFNPINEIDKYILVPPQMVPIDRGAVVALIDGMVMRDAFINSGDFLVITQRPSSINGRLILAVVNDELVIKRVQVKGNKATLKSLDDKFNPVTVPIKDVICLAEITGIIRITLPT